MDGNKAYELPSVLLFPKFVLKNQDLNRVNDNHVAKFYFHW